MGLAGSRFSLEFVFFCVTIYLDFEKKGHKKHIKITKLDQPEGTHLLTIDIEE